MGTPHHRRRADVTAGLHPGRTGVNNSPNSPPRLHPAGSHRARVQANPGRRGTGQRIWWMARATSACWRMSSREIRRSAPQDRGNGIHLYAVHGRGSSAIGYATPAMASTSRHFQRQQPRRQSAGLIRAPRHSLHALPTTTGCVPTRRTCTGYALMQSRKPTVTAIAPSADQNTCGIPDELHHSIPPHHQPGQ